MDDGEMMRTACMWMMRDERVEMRKGERVGWGLRDDEGGREGVEGNKWGMR